MAMNGKMIFTWLAGVCFLMNLLFPLSVYAEDDSFVIILLPDTQKYTEKKIFDKVNIYPDQTKWIVDKQTDYNIQYVVHLGDIVDDNNDSQWGIARDAQKELNGKIKYAMALGNHDYYPKKDVFHRDSEYSKYFKESFFVGTLIESFDDKKRENTISQFSYTTQEGTEIKFLVVSLEFLPRKDVVTWANEKIQELEENDDYWVIVVTHSYINRKGNYNGEKYNNEYMMVGRSGKGVWDELVSRHNNIFLALCGHITGIKHNRKKGNCGNDVTELLVDTQKEGLEGNKKYPNGNGWLYKLKFDLSSNEFSGLPMSVEDGNSNVFKDEGKAKFYTEELQMSDKEFKDDLDLLEKPPYEYRIGTTIFDERTVNSRGKGDQTDPSIAVNPANGSFVVVWEDDSDGNGVMDVYVRGFDNDGNEIFPDTQVNSVGKGQQVNPVVSMNSNGDFIIAWEDDKDNNKHYDILARGFNINGKQIIPDFRVNSVGSGEQKNPAIAMNSTDGNFVIAWEDDKDGNGVYNICASGFESSG